MISFKPYALAGIEKIDSNPLKSDSKLLALIERSLGSTAHLIAFNAQPDLLAQKHQ
jgi:hypothetical protein